MENNDHKNQIITIFAQQLNLAPESINLNENLETLGADSVDRVNIIMKLEEQFNVEISDEDAERINSIQDAINFIASRK